MSASAVFFDLDGLLADTEPVWTVAEKELARHYGSEWSDEVKAKVAGTRLEQAVPIMLEHFGRTPTPAAVDEAKARLLDRMVELFAESVPLFDGALELVDGVRARGIPTALVSSSYRALVDAALTRIGAARFDVTIAGDEVTHGKPDPEPYLTAAARLAVDPRRCTVLEDAPAGVASAEAAGCRVVAVPSVAPIEATPTRPVRKALADIDPDWLIGLPAATG